MQYIYGHVADLFADAVPCCLRHPASILDDSSSPPLAHTQLDSLGTASKLSNSCSGLCVFYVPAPLRVVMRAQQSPDITSLMGGVC